jgi:hypothetical protein
MNPQTTRYLSPQRNPMRQHALTWRYAVAEFGDGPEADLPLRLAIGWRKLAQQMKNAALSLPTQNRATETATEDDASLTEVTTRRY